MQYVSHWNLMKQDLAINVIGNRRQIKIGAKQTLPIN